MIVDLDTAKEHLRIESDDEDSLIEKYIFAAELWIKNYIDQDIPGADESPNTIPDDLKLAALVLIADFYTNRGDEMKDQMALENYAATRLCNPYKTMSL